MAGRLSHAASWIMGGTGGAVSRSLLSSLRQRSGLGPSVGKHIVPDKPLPVNDDLFGIMEPRFLNLVSIALITLGGMKLWLGGVAG